MLEEAPTSELGERLRKASELYENARTNLEFVKSDGSWGVHNLEYAESILDKAREDLENCLELVEE